MSDAGQPPTQPARDSWALVARRIRVPLGFVFAVVYVWLARPSRMSILTGGLLVLPGLLLRGLASGHVKKNEQLTTSGPYAYTRNPLYLGSLLLAAGFSIAARSWWIGLALVVMFFVVSGIGPFLAEWAQGRVNMLLDTNAQGEIVLAVAVILWVRQREQTRA